MLGSPSRFLAAGALAAIAAATAAAAAPSVASSPGVTGSARGAPSPAPAPAPRSSVLLLDAGKQPRTQLRYLLPSSYQEAISVTVTMAMDVGGAGESVKMALPPIRMKVKLAVTEKLGDDEARCKFEITAADVLPGGDQRLEVMRDRLSAELKKAIGAAGKLTVDRRGRSRDVSLQSPPGLDPQMGQAMESSRQAMEQVSAPLPEEPVGIGAKWQVDAVIEQNGLQIQQKSIFELTRLKGKKGQLKTTVTQTAAPQVVAMPSLPSGLNAELLSHGAAGSGVVELDLSRLVPNKASMSLKTDTAIKVSGLGQNQTMQMKADTRIDLGRL